MKCPRCALDLERCILYSVEVERCGRCNGVWFASGTIKPFLEAMALRRTDLPAARMQLRRHGAANKTPEIAEEAVSCPFCDSTMTEMNFAYDSNVFVPKCAVCGGVWADKLAIRKLLDFMKATVWRKVYR